MNESRQHSALARASQNRWQRLSFNESSFGSLFVSKGRTLDHRRSEQQQAPVAESLRLPPGKHGGEQLIASSVAAGADYVLLLAGFMAPS